MEMCVANKLCDDVVMYIHTDRFIMTVGGICNLNCVYTQPVGKKYFGCKLKKNVLVELSV